MQTLSHTLSNPSPSKSPLHNNGTTINSPYWKKVEPFDPETTIEGRNGHTSICLKNYLIIFGGKGGRNTQSYIEEMSILNMETLQWETVNKPKGVIPDKRQGHTACKYQEDKMIMYGGWNGSRVLNDIFALSIIKKNPLELEWKQMPSGENAPSRQFHTANIYKEKMWVFGGGDGESWLNTLNVYDLENKTWSLCKTYGKQPSGRLQHTSGLYENRLFIFGGESIKEKQLNDFYMLNLDSLNWYKMESSGQVPSARVSTSAQVIDNKMIFFGGYDGKIWLQDTFVFNIDHENWESVAANGSSPSPRSRHTSSFYENKLVIFGGNNSETCFSDLHCLTLPGSADLKGSQLVGDYRGMWKEKLFCDVVFKVGEKKEEIPAHKAILVARCEYFRNMFLGGYVESHASKVEIFDIKPEVFKGILEYIYCDELKLDEDLALELLIVADKYLLGRLKTLCEKYLVHRITVENVIEVINISDLHGANYLKESALDFMLGNRERIIETQDIAKMSKNLLIELYKRGGC